MFKRDWTTFSKFINYTTLNNGKRKAYVYNQRINKHAIMVTVTKYDTPESFLFFYSLLLAHALFLKHVVPES